MDSNAALVNDKNEHRIKFDMSLMSIIEVMCDGNVGASKALFALLYEHAGDHGPNGLLLILHLDSLHIYGERIWLLYSDVCRKNVSVMAKVLRAVGMKITIDVINYAIDNRGDGLDLSPYICKLDDKGDKS